MKHLTFTELRGLIDFDNIDIELLVQGFKLAGASSRPNHLFTTMDNLQADAEKHAQDNGWNPETMLVLYEAPPTEEEREAAAERTRRQIEEDPDWDDIQIGEVDPKQVVASVYKDMTSERLVKILLKPTNLKAFL